MSDNGWPGEPGVPLNPERDGWHWGERDGGLEPRFWSSGQQSWAGARNSWITPKMLAALFDYAGPCFTPAEVDARVSQAKREALEEAARVAEGKVYKERYRTWPWWLNRDGSEGNRSNDSDIVEHADKIAAEIRALTGGKNE